MKNFKLFSLITLSLLLNSCGDNTTTPISKDVRTTEGMIIDTPPSPVYSTDLFIPTATVYYDDGTTDVATQNVDWKRSDTSLLYLSNELTVLPLKNDGNSTLSAGYKSFKYFENNITIDIVGIIDINGTNKTWDTQDLDQNITGTHNLVAEGNFTNGTNNYVINRNIVWTFAGDAPAIITTVLTDNIYTSTIDITGTGDINITATLFADVNASISKVYTIN